MIPFDRIAGSNGCATAPEPIPSANGTPEAPPAAGNGRDARGRFAAGNRGGPGNPFARQTAAFRRALCAAVTEDDVTQIATILLDMAKAGDLAAIKLLLAYVVGRPVETVDPDTLDLAEWRQWSAAPDDPGEVMQVMTSPETGMLCEIARAVRPAMTQTFNRMMLGGLGEQAQRDARRAERQLEREARRAARREKCRAEHREAPTANGNGGAAAVEPPTANGDNGAPPPPSPMANGDNGTPPTPPPPIANGDNGGPPPDAAPMANGGNGTPSGIAPSDPLPPGLLKLVGAMLGRAFRARPPDGTAP